MAFGSKRAGGLRLRDIDSRDDALFESDWDALVIRFDSETGSYRVMKASDRSDEEMQVNKAKVAAADV
ncbi:MAG TPA: hypothetical protein VGJ02_11115 [Pyrinomonadaceae bacterium]